MAEEPNKIIYSMIGVSKSYDQKVVLKDIYSLLLLRRKDRRAGA